MKILLFGGSGQLGHELRKRAYDLDFEVISPVLSEVDISDRDQVKFLSHKTKPDLILNAAAYTAVDKAEAEQEQAYRINRDGAAYVAEAAKAVGARLMHISTDYVFDGTAHEPIDESVKPNPINVYGASKLAGEQAVIERYADHTLIVRTSSLHGQKGENFVHTMLKLFAEKDVVKVVTDQYMSPTWAGWLAEVCLDLGRIKLSGVVHASSAGVISWYEFAQKIHEIAGHKPDIGKLARLEETYMSEFARPARRPAYSGFNCAKLASLIGRNPISWQEGLHNHMRELGYF